MFRRLFNILGIDPQILIGDRRLDRRRRQPDRDPPGAEQPYYLGLRPPIVVRNGPLLTMRELLLVRGVTPSVLARLEGFVTVLAHGNGLKVNINTAPPEVLYALSDGMLADPGVVDRLIASRDTEAFISPSEALKNVTGLEQALGTGKEFIDSNSAYFRLEGVGEVDEVRRGIVEVVRRDGQRITRVTWTPSNANLALTSLPPSDFLATLPVFGDR